jgi:hypothetical protein
MGKTYVGDIGTKITLDAGSDISGQTTLQIQFKKPDGTTGAWAANVESSNYATYTTVAGDLDVAGSWKLQIYVELPAWTGRGAAVELIVFDQFK